MLACNLLLYFNPFATKCVRLFHSYHLVCDSVRYFMISTSPRAVTRTTTSFAQYRAGKILAISVFKTRHGRLVRYSAKTLQTSMITLSPKGGSGETGLFLYACFVFTMSRLINLNLRLHKTLKDKRRIVYNSVCCPRSNVHYFDPFTMGVGWGKKVN